LTIGCCCWISRWPIASIDAERRGCARCAASAVITERVERRIRRRQRRLRGQAAAAANDAPAAIRREGRRRIARRGRPSKVR
jgi:hypothetical protein